MTDSNEEVPWEGRRIQAAYEFGLRCRELRDSDPYRDTDRWEPVLIQIMTDLATELWDQTFSQTEIATAFKKAIERLSPYAAGEERRGDRTSQK